MSAIVLELPTQIAVEDAWDDYARLCLRLRDEPDLINDGDWVATLTAARERWNNLFMAWRPKC